MTADLSMINNRGVLHLLGRAMAHLRHQISFADSVQKHDLWDAHTLLFKCHSLIFTERQLEHARRWRWLAIFLPLLLILAPACHAQQRYLCTPEYTTADCKAQFAVLKPLLDKYHAEGLGPWTWLLVKSTSWTRVHSADPDSPAFTVLDKRTTVFEEALFRPVASRDGVLLAKWGMGRPDLLNLAVTHELGHAICDDRDERKADANGERLRHGLPAVCR